MQVANKAQFSPILTKDSEYSNSDHNVQKISGSIVKLQLFLVFPLELVLSPHRGRILLAGGFDSPSVRSPHIQLS